MTMAEMNRNRDQQDQGSNRQRQGEDTNRDMQGGRSQQQKEQWDGSERRTGAERRIDYGSNDMNQGSSR